MSSSLFSGREIARSYLRIFAIGLLLGALGAFVIAFESFAKREFGLTVFEVALGVFLFIGFRKFWRAIDKWYERQKP